MAVVHPVADEFTDEHYVWVAQTRRVLLTPPLAAFLDAAVTDRVRPVLVTGEDVWLSPFVSLALRRAGAHWAVWTEHDGVFDGLSGLRIDRFSELWWRSGNDDERDRLAWYGRLKPGGVGVLMFDVFAHSRADAGTQIGRLGEVAVTALGGRAPELWGPHEPLLERWDTAALTVAAKASMPASDVLHGAGPDGSFVDVVVARSRHGLLEQAKGGVVLGPYPDRLAEPVARASAALTRVAADFRATIGFVSLAKFDDGPGQSLGAKPVEAPLAVLIGARGVHELGLDVDAVVASHDATVLGTRRAPAVVVRFSDPDVGLWAQLVAFAYDVGPQRIAEAARLGGWH